MEDNYPQAKAQCHLVKQNLNDMPTLSKVIGWVVYYIFPVLL